MAESISQKIGNKSGHIFNQGMMWLRKGAQIGAVIGAAAAIGTLLLTANFAAIGVAGLVMAAAGYGIGGAIGGAVAGLCSGGVFGTLKGMLTRPKPNGEQIMQDALNCAEPHGPEPAPAKEPQLTPQPGQQMPAAQPEAPQAPQQPAVNSASLPKQAIAELNAMTKTLNEIQATAQADAATPASAPQVPAQQPAPQQPAMPANWAQRVQQPAATEQRQR